MDVLGDLLGRARAHGAIFAHSDLRAPWGLELRDRTPLSFHAVLEGELHLDVGEGRRARLLQGDVALVRSGRPYRMTHAAGAPAPPLDEVLAACAPGEHDGRRLVRGGAGARTVFLCGAYAFDGSVCDTLLDALPPLVVLPAAAAPPALRTAVGLLAEEAGTDAAGQQTALDRLLDLLLVYVLRSWFAAEPGRAPAWYDALDDPAVGPALRALHEDHRRPWTVAELAAVSGLSRAAFARNFSARLGRAPLAYLTAWRMVLARDALVRPGATVASVAREVGYANEFAFAAAFKREHGVAPGRWRSEARARVAVDRALPQAAGATAAR